MIGWQLKQFEKPFGSLLATGVSGVMYVRCHVSVYEQVLESSSHGLEPLRLRPRSIKNFYLFARQNKESS